jgi:glycosyltransferase involved in cell wall biosynthesis
LSVAIVHDFLNQRGGAERVVLDMARLFPTAPIYTLLYRPDSTYPEFEEFDVRTPLIDRLPVDKRFRALLPLYPAAVRSLGVIDEATVISSSSGWAHAVRTRPTSTHVVYCYTPARWLYISRAHLEGRLVRAAATPLFPALRRWDRKAARRPDRYIAISQHVRRRIQSVYGFDSDVVYPPVDVDRFTPRPRGERLLVISRLLPYKRVDLVVKAANQAGLGLDVVGTGPSLGALRDIAGPTVTLHGRLDDDSITALIEGCRAVCFPGNEDFGIVPVEANAAGKPVVAFAAGGALETIEEGRTGVFFHDQRPEAVLDALRAADALETPPDEIAAAARRFSPDRFRKSLLEAVERIQHHHRERLGPE